MPANDILPSHIPVFPVDYAPSPNLPSGIQVPYKHPVPVILSWNHLPDGTWKDVLHQTALMDSSSAPDCKLSTGWTVSLVGSTQPWGIRCLSEAIRSPGCIPPNHLGLGALESSAVDQDLQSDFLQQIRESCHK
jgi:hypothetical protein